MRKRRICLTCAAAALALRAGAVSPSPFGDEVAEKLIRQGFGNIHVETTWLGRERIVAERTDGLREIILNPRSGEILRDTWTGSSGATTTRPIVDDVGEDGGNGTGSSGSGKDGSGNDASGDHTGSGGGGGGDSGGGDWGGGGSGGGGGGGGGDGGGDHSGDGKGGKGKGD